MTDVINQESAETPKSQARIFQEKFAADAGENMRKTISRTIRRATVITMIVLGVSMPHQVSYLLAKTAPFLHWTQWNNWVGSIGIIMIAVAMPVVSDLLIISAIEQISSPAASLHSKFRALGALVVPLGASGYVNFAADGPLLIKVLAALLVFYVIVSETLKFVRPDFKKIDKIENETLADVREVVPVRRPRFNKAKDKVLHLMATEPALSARDLAKRANVSVNYVYSVRRAAKAESAA